MTLPAISAPIAVSTRDLKLPQAQSPQSTASESVAMGDAIQAMETAPVLTPLRLPMNADRLDIAPSKRAEIPFQRRRVEIQAPFGACLLRTGTRICRIARG